MSKNASPFTLFAAGAIVGLIVGYALSEFRTPPALAEPGEATRAEEPAVLEAAGPTAAELALREQVEQLEAQNAELRASFAKPDVAENAGPTRVGRAGPAMTLFAGESGNADPEAALAQMRPHMQRFADMQLAKYQGRLNLTDAQRQALRDIIVLRQEQMHLGMMARQIGDGANGAVPGGQVTNQDVLDLASEIMSPEQFEEYQSIQAEERQLRSEMAATARLGQLAPMLGLSDEQKDAAYSLFYAEAEGIVDFANPGALAETRDRTYAALESVLTPEQRAAFQAYLEQQQANGGGEIIFFGGP